MLSRLFANLAAASLLALLQVTPAAAQTGNIAGQISDVETMSPLAGARVEAVAAGGDVVATAVSDENGRYRLAGLSPGLYTVVVGRLAFETRRIESVEVVAGATTDLSLDLSSFALRLNPVVVTVGRSSEKALDAPASISVVDSRAIGERPALTPVDHLRATPGVDVITHGLAATNVVARGFNNIFSTALHMLTDNRIAAVPSLRVNLMHWIPAVDSDIDRIEAVLGPGAALYGPNTANGVVHIITKSPLDDQGTIATIGGGERSVFQTSFRTSQLLSENVGVKLSGQYMRGDEWEYTDPVERDAREQALIADPNTRIGLRDFSLERYSGEIRADWRVTPDFTAVLSAGGTRAASGIELTGIGAGQVQDWTYMYYQVRANYNRLFAQAYLNTSDAGDTFLLRDGAGIVDNSKLFVAQLQHGVSLAERQSFTYGVDFLRTMGDTEGTVHGQHEDDDTINEIGIYLQSETALTPKFDLVLAGRLDEHSWIDATVFSPRAALVFKPSGNHTFRGTFNRAFSTPASVNLFLDIFGGPMPAPLGPFYGIRAQGTSDTGFTFRQPDGGYLMRSPVMPGQLLPANAATMWALTVGVLQAQGGIDGETAQYMMGITPSDADLGINALDLTTFSFARLDERGVLDVPPIRESRNTTYEIGYKGIIGNRLLLNADVWYEQRKDFISPLTPQVPLLFMHPEDLIAYAGPRLTQHFMGRGMTQEQAMAAAGQLIQVMAELPVGVVSSPDVNAQGAEVLVSYRNFGDVNLYGTDISLTALLSDEWSVGGMLSLVSDDHFFTEGHLVTLNASRAKGAVTADYRNARLGFNGNVRARYTKGFPANSAEFVGAACVTGEGEPCLDDYTLVDLVLGYQLPTVRNATLQLAVNNVFDTKYRSFIGVPEIGRLALLRLRYEF